MKTIIALLRNLGVILPPTRRPSQSPSPSLAVSPTRRPSHSPSLPLAVPPPRPLPHSSLPKAITLLALSLALSACSASSQGLSSRNFDTPAKAASSKSQPSIASAPTLNLDLSVDAAYAAIPHRRTAMDFAASNMPDQDKRFLQVAFHLIDQAIRLRVSAYQKFLRGESGDSQIADFDSLIDYLKNTEAPAGLTNYQTRLLQALSDQRAFFQEWQTAGQQYQYGSPQTIGTSPRVQKASSALREAYGILMELYPNENDSNKAAFFDYHCALDFI